MVRTLALLLAGCYAPSIRSGDPCDLDCPGDLVCIDHVCREPGYVVADAPPADAPVDTIDGPPGDLDADTIDDMVDNCPGKPNQDQHDEDTDGIGDVCDPCPHVNGAATDSDGDGVGDACDPQPSTPKQRILFFDPFTSLRSIWQVSQGFTVTGDQLRGNGTDASGAYVKLNVPTGELRIVTAGTVPSVLATTPHSFSLSFGFNATGTYFFYVQFYDQGPGSGTVSILNADNGTYTNLAGHNYAGILPTGAWSMTIDESVAAQRITYTAKLGGVSYTTLTGNTTGLTTSSSQSLYVRHADFRYDYYLVIETLP